MNDWLLEEYDLHRVVKVPMPPGSPESLFRLCPTVTTVLRERDFERILTPYNTKTIGLDGELINTRGLRYEYQEPDVRPCYIKEISQSHDNSDDDLPIPDLKRLQIKANLANQR